jgi:hypothetical protein
MPETASQLFDTGGAVMVVKYDARGGIDLEATGRAVDGAKQYIAAEAVRSIAALAADARGHQWLHSDTAKALDEIRTFARLAAEALGDEVDEDGEDFPP